MKDFKFANGLLLFWPGYEPRPNYRGLMGLCAQVAISQAIRKAFN